MAGLAGIRALWRHGPWRTWAVAAVLGRLLSTMVVLGYVLVAEAVYDSIPLGALLAGTATFSAGFAAPLIGRLLDRRGLRRGLLRCLWITAAVLALESLVVLSAAPPSLLFVLAVLQGVAYGGVPGAYRALLVRAAPQRELLRANTLDAVLTEVGFVAGPALAGSAAAAGGPTGVMGLMITIVTVAALVTARLPAVPPVARAAAVSPWRRAPARAVYAVCFTLGASVGMFESVMAARVAEIGHAPESAGPILALSAVGSGIAGFVLSTLEDQRGRVVRRALLGLSALGAALLLSSQAQSLLLLAVIMLAVGMPIAPLNATGTQRLQDVLDGRQLAEGFALYTALILVGVGLGGLLTGQLLPLLGASRLLQLSAALPLLAAVVIAWRSARAETSPVPTPAGGRPR